MNNNINILCRDVINIIKKYLNGVCHNCKKSNWITEYVDNELVCTECLKTYYTNCESCRIKCKIDEEMMRFCNLGVNVCLGCMSLIVAF